MSEEELTQEQKDLFHQAIHSRYIQPEIDRRTLAGEISEGFAIREYLILFPISQPPIVKFNDEFGWLVKNPKLSDGRNLEINRTYYLHDIVKIDTVLAPTVKDKHFPFLYGHHNGFSWVIFVGSHNDPSKNAYIANQLQKKLIAEATKLSQVHLNKLREIGLWTATSLLPYPISKIIERIGAGYPDEARQVLIDHCDSEFLSKTIVDTWHPITVFLERMSFFQDALFCHSHGRYHGSISILVGQVEGIITDWLYEIDHYQLDKERKVHEKIEDFGTVLSEIPNLSYTYREARDSMLGFLGSEPWLQRFNEWMVQSDTSFVGRHVAQHGKYDHRSYTEENSIKLFLLLDNICQFMMFYEVRVLNRDIGQYG